ncbi:DUF1850 domain-containing protein [Pontibacillus yanchengensis]|uniref:DUF1850 domain-containing protein n=2 Tax=Pontibacillus yanchengensis TaxID=462910 RepID=A0A6I4ZU62_9BACI|nr:DUF1850 domain-containing protein [Pontibacillus yanchengensis]MYL32196.1 DUF1850 domain-containing protein [Pontibacillus yanchengensis]MYL52776.1 DUF1850 domain-containing protein [Pontibacillus yanchengensis]
MARSTKKWGTLTAIIFILIAALATYIFYPYHYILTFEKQRTGELLAYLPIEENRNFHIKYTHSVHLSEVVEYYQAIEGNIKPVKLVYEDTAIGMPSDAHGEDTFRMEDGKYIIEKSENATPFEELNLSVGQVRAEHKVIHNNQTYLLKNYVGAGTNVTIDAQTRSRWQLWKGVNMLE